MAHDPGQLQPGQRLRLTLKAAPLGLVGVPGQQQLERDLLARGRVAAAVDDAHLAPRGFAQDLIAPDPGGLTHASGWQPGLRRAS